MKVLELHRHLTEVIARYAEIVADAEVVFRAEKDDVMKKADFTLTYITERRDGAAKYDQVPVLLIEPVEEQDKEQWVCEHCNYMNVGVICTHCGVPRGKA